MSILEQIEQDLRAAMKEKDETKTSTLRMLKSSVHNWQIAQQKEPQDQDLLGIMQKEIKARKDSIEMYKQGGRAELAEKEQKEITFLEKYLPAQISEEEIRSKVKNTIAKVSANGPQDMGKVMGPVMAELKGQADGSTVSRLVKEELSK